MKVRCLFGIVGGGEVRAYLWTPLDLIRLDLEPRLHTAERRLAFLDRRLTHSAAPLGNTTRRAAALVTVLTVLVEEARRLPAHDARAAKRWIAELEQRATRLRGRWPAWMYTRAAEHAAYRLLPHPVLARPGSQLPSAVQSRIEYLRAHGALVVEPDSAPSTGGVARRSAPSRRSRTANPGQT